MTNSAYLSVLRKIYKRLSSTDINWALTGSLSFALQGVPLEPHDIDIQTDEAGAYEIEHLFAEYVTREVLFSSTDKIRSHFGELMIDGIKVDIMGNIEKRLHDGTWEGSVDMELNKKFVEVAGMRIPVLSLEYEYQAYLKLGRRDTAEMLEKWLRGSASESASSDTT
jgi:hypothetical protein